jgi:C-terminal processing protease CtpA/Prc
MKPRSIGAIATLVLVAAASGIAQQYDSGTARLAATAKLWITVKYFHPYLAYQDIDWDKALVEALPKIRSAKTPDEYAAATQQMLDALHDPETHMLGSASQNAAAGPYKPETSKPDKGADIPGQRTWVHYGLTPEARAGYSGYYSAFYTKPGRPITPGEGTMPGVETISVPLGEGHWAVVRLSESINADGTSPISGARLPAFPTPKPERAYAEMSYPAVEYRLLAAFKIWGVFKYFFAYRDLLDEDWDQVLLDYLPKFVAAKDALEYNLAVAEMVTHVHDSHAGVSSKELAAYFGVAPVPIQLRLIDKKPVVTRIYADAAKSAGIKVGDIVHSVDGEDIALRINREAKYLSASTNQWLGYVAAQRLLNGPDGSTATLVVSDGEGQREVKLERRTAYSSKMREGQRSGELMKLLDGNIGYADLDRLTPDQVDEMFDKFRDTKAIIFDMRGYPKGTAWAIAPRLTDKQDVEAAIFTGPITMTPDLPNGDATHSSSTYFFVQTIPHSDQWKYKGKTVMLIDERTISQAEHTGLFLQAANKTKFIGSPTAGANGDVTNFVVPGGITIGFSGHDVRMASGGQLQRNGLQPDVFVVPTLNGIRHGRDEVLEKAIEYVSQ